MSGQKGKTINAETETPGHESMVRLSGAGELLKDLGGKMSGASELLKDLGGKMAVLVSAGAAIGALSGVGQSLKQMQKDLIRKMLDL